MPGSKPPGKLTGKGAQSRERIVAAAAELMFEGGVAGKILEMVPAAARVSGSQIYNYFADKETLVRAVVAYQNDTIAGGQEPMLAQVQRSTEPLEVALDTVIDYVGSLTVPVLP